MQKSLNEYMQNVHRDLVWTGNCASWCKSVVTSVMALPFANILGIRQGQNHWKGNCCLARI
jgi:hypothetical protein